MIKFKQILIEQKLQQFTKDNLKGFKIFLVNSLHDIGPFTKISQSELNNAINKLLNAQSENEIIKIIKGYNPNYDQSKASEIARKLINAKKRLDASGKDSWFNKRLYIALFFQTIVIALSVVFASITGMWILPAVGGGIALRIYRKFVDDYNFPSD